MKPHPMEARFHQFAMQVAGAECIDEVVAVGSDPGRRADYLWRDRSVIVELKTLTADPQPKINQEIDRLSKRSNFPLIVGEAPLANVLRHIPDGDEVMRRLHQKVMRSIEGAFRGAKRQVANTKSIFGLHDAMGLLVVLNPDIETLSPADAGNELSRLLMQRQQDLMAVDAVWLLSEAHTTSGAHPCIFITGDRIGRFDWADEFLDGLNADWARFNKSRLLKSAGPLEDLLIDDKRPQVGEPGARHETWRARYRANPYLHELKDADVLVFGQQQFAALLPYVVKGGPRVPMADLEPILVRWTHFLEEAGQRGLDIRGFEMGRNTQ